MLTIPEKGLCPGDTGTPSRICLWKRSAGFPLYDLPFSLFAMALSTLEATWYQPGGARAWETRPLPGEAVSPTVGLTVEETPRS